MGEEMADWVLLETWGTLLPFWACTESPVAGGEATCSTPNLLRNSWYFSLPLAVTGISPHSLSNWRKQRAAWVSVDGRNPGAPPARRGQGSTGLRPGNAKENGGGGEPVWLCLVEACERLGERRQEDYSWLLQDIF